MLNCYISKINYEIPHPSNRVANKFLLFCFIVEYLFSTVHAIGDFREEDVKAEDHSFLK